MNVSAIPSTHRNDLSQIVKNLNPHIQFKMSVAGDLKHYDTILNASFLNHYKLWPPAILGKDTTWLDSTLPQQYPEIIQLREFLQQTKTFFEKDTITQLQAWYLSTPRALVATATCFNHHYDFTLRSLVQRNLFLSSSLTDDPPQQPSQDFQLTRRNIHTDLLNTIVEAAADATVKKMRHQTELVTAALEDNKKTISSFHEQMVQQTNTINRMNQ